jgi:hypothetical protein
VPPVLAQVDNDSVGPGQFRDDRGRDRVWILAAPGLSQSGYMIDIHRQFGHEFLLLKSDQYFFIFFADGYFLMFS